MGERKEGIGRRRRRRRSTRICHGQIKHVMIALLFFYPPLSLCLGPALSLSVCLGLSLSLSVSRSLSLFLLSGLDMVELWSVGAYFVQEGFSVGYSVAELELVGGEMRG